LKKVPWGITPAAIAGAHLGPAPGTNFCVNPYTPASRGGTQPPTPAAAVVPRENVDEGLVGGEHKKAAQPWLWLRHQQDLRGRARDTRLRDAKRGGAL